MKGPKSLLTPMVTLFLLWVVACLASGSVLAQVSHYVVINPIDVCLASTSNGTVTKSCAPFGVNCATQSNGGTGCGALFNDPVAATSSPQSIASTPIGFVDMSTNPATGTANNINITRAIWLQGGLDVVFLPIQEFDSPICATAPGATTTTTSCNMIPTNGTTSWSSFLAGLIPAYSWPATDYRTLHVVPFTCPGTTNALSPSPDLAALTGYTLASCGSSGPPPTTTVKLCPTCAAPPVVPLAANLSNLSNPNAINMFFVNQIQNGYNGFSWINGNGIAIAANTFSLNSSDVLAHEIGHALNLTHTGLGAGSSCTGNKLYPSYSTGLGAENGCNLMDSGVYPSPSCPNCSSTQTFRVIPTTTGCLSNLVSPGSPFGGELFDLDTALCGTSKSETPPAPQADQILLGTSTTTQQGMALSSGFVVPVANVPTTATAGGGKAAATTTTTAAVTSTASTITNFNCTSPNSPINFAVKFPKFQQAGGRSADEFIVSLILALPQDFAFGANPICQVGTGPKIVSAQILNGNNGQGNTNCLKPISGTPSIQCLEIDFQVTEPTPGSFVGSFTTNTTLTFTSDIVNKSTSSPATLSQLRCTTPAPGQCLDLTYVFNDLFATTSFFGLSTSTTLAANSQFPNVTVNSTIVSPSNFANLPADYPPFTGVPGAPACTLTSGSNSCPPGNGPSGLMGVD